MTASRLLITTAMIVAVIGVTACGRRAALDRPIDAQYDLDRDAARKAGKPVPPPPSKETPDRRFILDGLID